MPGMFELMFSVLLSLLCIFVVFRSHRLSERSPQSRILFSIAVALVSSCPIALRVCPY